MALEEKEYIDMISYRDGGFIEVRKVFLVLKDGVEIARRYHRHVVEPGQEDLSSEDEKVKSIAQAVDGHRKKAAVKLAKEREAMIGDPEDHTPEQEDVIIPPAPKPEPDEDPEDDEQPDDNPDDDPEDEEDLK